MTKCLTNKKLKRKTLPGNQYFPYRETDRRNPQSRRFDARLHKTPLVILAEGRWINDVTVVHNAFRPKG